MDQRQLLDLPPAWLGSMVLGVAEPPQLRPLFRTCSNLQQLILHQTAIRPWLRVRIHRVEEFGEDLHAQALAMAEAAETKLSLDLEIYCAEGQALGQLLSSAAALVEQAQQPQEAPAPLQLTCITDVNIEGYDECVLDSFLPDTLVQLCPNLQELRLWSVIITEQYRIPQLTCTSLQKLTLDHVEGFESAGFKQHLLDLPSLTCLDLWQSGSAAHFEEGGVFWAAIARYSSQLSVLCCRRIHGVLTTLPWSPTTYLPQLQELELGIALEGNYDMQQLLTTTPDLKRISLRGITGLTRSFTQVPCSWQQLKLMNVHVADLAMLPLASCTRLTCVCKLYLRKGDADEQSTPGQITAAVNAVQTAGGLRFDGSIKMTLYADDLERLTAAAPLLEHIGCHTYLDVHKPGTGQDAPWSDCRPLLAVLGQHLRCEVLHFYWNGWADSPGAAAQLPELLPHVNVFDFWCHPPPEAELVKLVRTARRPFTVRLHSDVLKAQLRRVIQKAGHQLVTIK